MLVCRVVFFFKQKTAYEMRISDWSSDVCSSDLSRPSFIFDAEKDDFANDLRLVRHCRGQHEPPLPAHRHVDREPVAAAFVAETNSARPVITLASGIGIRRPLSTVSASATASPDDRYMKIGRAHV